MKQILIIGVDPLRKNQSYHSTLIDLDLILKPNGKTDSYNMFFFFSIDPLTQFSH